MRKTPSSFLCQIGKSFGILNGRSSLNEGIELLDSGTGIVLTSIPLAETKMSFIYVNFNKEVGESQKTSKIEFHICELQ